MKRSKWVVVLSESGEPALGVLMESKEREPALWVLWHPRSPAAAQRLRQKVAKVPGWKGWMTEPALRLSK